MSCSADFAGHGSKPRVRRLAFGRPSAGDAHRSTSGRGRVSARRRTTLTNRPESAVSAPPPRDNLPGEHHPRRLVLVVADRDGNGPSSTTGAGAGRRVPPRPAGRLPSAEPPVPRVLRDSMPLLGTNKVKRRTAFGVHSQSEVCRTVSNHRRFVFRSRRCGGPFLVSQR